MNCDQIAQLWDDYRDGTLDAQRRGWFAAHLAACGRCAQRYERESAWLGALSEPAAARAQEDAAFVQTVLERWQEPARPVAVLRWKVTAIAAMVALGAVLSMALLISQTDEPEQVAVAPTSPDNVTDGAVDPVSVLMLDMTRHLDQQPPDLRQTIDQTASANLRALVDLFATLDETNGPRQPRG